MHGKQNLKPRTRTESWLANLRPTPKMFEHEIESVPGFQRQQPVKRARALLPTRTDRPFAFASGQWQWTDMKRQSSSNLASQPSVELNEQKRPLAGADQAVRQ